MEITREQIIEQFSNKFTNNPFVYALWLEGADATDTVDEFSDIDFWLDVEDDYVEIIFNEIEGLLTAISPLDFIYEAEHSHPKVRHKIYHLQNTSEYLKLDINVQSHSRKSEESEFVTDDPIESPKVIFDKAEVIRFCPADEIALHRRLQERIYHLEHMFSHTGVRRYVKRNEFLEALAIYHRYVLEPLVELLRIRYTPLHHYYGPVHISRHLPKEAVLELEDLYRVVSMDELLTGIYKAERLFKETLAVVNKERHNRQLTEIAAS